MKFQIEVVNPNIGKIKSEVYTTDFESYEQITKNISNPNKNTTMIDFNTPDGNFVIINEEIFKNSVIYFKIISEE